MDKKLVIVESPAKARTIHRYLGEGYLVKASMGHIRDLPKRSLGVDIKNDFKPEYRIIPERRKNVLELKKTARLCDSIYLAADPDREGEAICWHLSQVLKDSNKNLLRVILHEITKRAVEKAFRNPGQLDQNKINAQQTRRILDRLVGYLISPLLWKKIGGRLSAGRVQSIALRLICEREKEIREFIPQEFWTIKAHLCASEPPCFFAQLTKIEGKRAKIENQKEAERIISELRGLPFIIERIRVEEKKRIPPPPYITSTLQQDCFRLLRFSVRKTMSVAQRLYEGVDCGEYGLVGLITYMRTDSVRVSNEALSGARKYIETHFPREYLPPKPRLYKNKKKAQDAHEAIRPTSFDLPPEKVKGYLKKEEFALYSLVWNRFMASQMNPALIEESEFEIGASKYQFTAKGEVIKFDGYLVLYPNLKKEDKILPRASEREELSLKELECKQNFTQPPSRYTEGSLVKELEARGIGRPSTYAPIIATLQDRTYVIKEKEKFIPTELGIFVTDFLIKNFPDLMEFEFTARLEEELDKISEGERNWVEYLRSYYSLLDGDLKRAKEAEGVRGAGIPLEEKCPECGRNLLLKEGRYGRFRACSGYPECRYRESLIKREKKLLEEKCPQCKAPLVLRKGKYGSFISCSNYPQCNYVKKEKKETGIPCPLNCGGMIIKKRTIRGRFFYGCSKFPACKFATWDEPILEACPKCGKNLIFKKTIKGKQYLYCRDENCDFKKDVGERIEMKENEKLEKTANHPLRN